MFNRQQYIAIFSAVSLLLVMYFGCDRVPINHKSTTEEPSQAVAEDATIEELISKTKAKLAPEVGTQITNLEQQLKLSVSDTAKSNLMKKISGLWYSQSQKVLSGYYAYKIASIDNNEKGWNIAGATLYEGINEAEDAGLKEYCTKNAVTAFDNAIKMAPTNVNYQVNQALCYVANPPQDNQMKGILMLRELDKKFPDDPKVLFQLAKLAIKTNQYDKAVARLEQILKKYPNNAEAICYLADAYEGAGNEAQAKVFAKKCEALFKK